MKSCNEVNNVKRSSKMRTSRRNSEGGKKKAKRALATTAGKKKAKRALATTALATTDAEALHRALHGTASRCALSSGVRLDIVISEGGQRRVDVRDPGTGEWLVQLKAASERVLDPPTKKRTKKTTTTTQTTWIIPLDADGRSAARAEWGKIVDGRVTKRSSRCAD